MQRSGGQTTRSPGGQNGQSAPDVFTPVRTSRVYTEVVTQILGLVESGQIGRGDRLPAERQLAERLQVSRSSVREAMTALEVLGVVEIKAGHGIFVGRQSGNQLIKEVSELTAEQGPLEILEARLVLEPGIAELAARRATPSDVSSIRKQIDLMEDELDRGLDAWKPDWGFHEAISRAAQNSLAEAMLDVVTKRSEHPLWIRMRSHNFEQRAHAFHYLEHHRAIFAAIESRDAKAAFRTMKRHIQTIQRDLGVDLRTSERDRTMASASGSATTSVLKGT